MTDPETGDVQRGPFGRPIRLDPEVMETLRAERWQSNPDVKEVPSYLLARDRWKTVMADRWVLSDDILRLEARALVKAASRAAHSQPIRDCRVLLLGDNLAVVLCFSRSSSRDFRLLVQLRRLAALSLARNIRFAARWVPSEFNSGDEGSRKSEVRRRLRC